MKVRLKLPLVCKSVSSSTWFQFHEGPIKTLYLSQNTESKTMFQFHEGPIKTSKVCECSRSLPLVSIP